MGRYNSSDSSPCRFLKYSECVYLLLQEEGKQTDYASLQAMDLQQILKESFKFWLRKSRGYQRRHGPVSVFTIKVFSVLGTDRPIPAVSL